MGTARDAEAPDREERCDVELLRRVAAGDGVAFAKLAIRLGPILRRVLFRLGLSEVEVDDALQETLIRIWRGSAGFQARSSVSSWACRIAINQGVTALRSRQEKLPEDRTPPGDTESHWELGVRAQAVRGAVLALPVHLRTVVVLREFEDLTYRSIAEILEVPIGTVMSRLHEARARLRRELAALV
jgi:RNA polymerase sigma-70 factor (ECF subfamily)